MKNKIKLIFPILFAIATLSGCGEKPVEVHFTKYAADLPDALPGYYSNFQFNAKSRSMLTQIHTFHFEKHTTYVKYSSLGDYYNSNTQRDSIDCPVKGTDQIEYFYTGKVTTGKKFQGNREHVWPCANSGGLWTHNKEDGTHYVDGTGYKGGGSDLYHVRPCNDDVNTARGNSRFIDFDDYKDKSFTVKTETGGRFGILLNGLNEAGEYASFAEVSDEYKGDLARLICYVYTHYATIGSVLDDKYQQYCGSLSLTDILGYSEKQAKIKLCEWNELDPPSQTEINRNNTVQLIQGNRNIFVDHPGLIPRMFGLE